MFSYLFYDLKVMQYLYLAVREGRGSTSSPSKHLASLLNSKMSNIYPASHRKEIPKRKADEGFRNVPVQTENVKNGFSNKTLLMDVKRLSVVEKREKWEYLKQNRPGGRLGAGSPSDLCRA